MCKIRQFIHKNQRTASNKVNGLISEGLERKMMIILYKNFQFWSLEEMAVKYSHGPQNYPVETIDVVLHADLLLACSLF